MAKFRVWFEQTNTLDIEVEAEDSDEAFNKADEILCGRTFEENVKN